MSFFDLNNNFKSIISKHCNLQKSLFGEIVFVDDFQKIKTTPGRMNDDDDFNSANICKNIKI
jgi:hypothetical protein